MIPSRSNRWFVAFFGLIVFAGAAELAQGGPPSPASSPDKSFDTANLDTTCKPCQDFYRYATGGWMARNAIPAQFSTWGTFTILAEHNKGVVHQILDEESKKTSARGSNEQKIGDFYGSCMDTAKIEEQGLEPLAPEFARIAAISNAAGLQAEFAHLQRAGYNAVFAFGSSPDLSDSSQVIGFAAQGGLGLPDRDYYFNDDPKSKTLLADYQKHVAKMFALLGDSEAKAEEEARTVVKLETSLAGAQMKKDASRDPQQINHRMDRAGLKQLTAKFSWDTYLSDVGGPGIAIVNVNQPDYFKEIDRDLNAVPLADWKTYLRWHVVHDAAPALADKFVQENFAFYGQELSGQKEIKPRWNRCSTETDDLLGEALGPVYVARAFPPEAKARALELVHNLIAALRTDLETLDWMGPETRKQAQRKLDKLQIKIGYPDKWRDYSKLTIDRSSYVANRDRASAFEFQRNLDEIGKPVDRTEWGLTPPTVDAYYNPQFNEIVFPAGILQPPFFDFHADDALNYGAIGAVIGHEITHGFDNHGREFDSDGNLKDWWTPEDAKNFDARAMCVEKQFDGYQFEPEIPKNGHLVLGESIADLGGLTIAHAALERSLEGKPAPPLIDGFTADQRFFLGWAQVWETNMRPEWARLRARTNEHPLPQYRINGPLSNMDIFAQAYGCKAGNPMVRAERCKIW